LTSAMANLQETFKKQTELGEQIKSLASNYEKDSAVRKRSHTYFQERICHLTKLFDEFEQQDSSIRTYCENPLEFEYFTGGLYEQIQSLAH
jgi:hypothetical protein